MQICAHSHKNTQTHTHTHTHTHTLIHIEGMQRALALACVNEHRAYKERMLEQKHTEHVRECVLVQAHIDHIKKRTREYIKHAAIAHTYMYDTHANVRIYTKRSTHRACTHTCITHTEHAHIAFTHMYNTPTYA